MTKRLGILLALLLGVTGLTGLNWSMMQVAQAQVIAPQTPMAGPDPAIAPDIVLLNTLSAPLPVIMVTHENSSDIFTTRRSDGVLSTQNLSSFGPWSCTHMGDPFSPDASPWAPGLYTYQYRIRIPAAYPQDTVRVELFDPDSINQNGSTFDLTHTDLAQSLGMPPFETKTCPVPDYFQYDPCLLDTGELNLSSVTIDNINPLWFVRIDETRTGTSGSNNACGPSDPYNPSDNTQTVYDLYYYTQNLDGTQQRVSLATYTGQVGDGVRDDGSHLTDMQWVAPGSPVSLGQPAAVPTDCGSPNGGDYDPITCPGGTPAGAGSGFEVDLTQDVPGLIVDPATGDRYLYLDVTAISGASENGFDIWAGPNSYVNDIPSDVNLRNVSILNNFGSHDAQGVTVFALDNLPLNSSYNNRIDIPLTEVGANYADQTIEVSLFDSDSGAQTPIHFYFDSIAFDDWHVTYTGTEGGRCQVGNCNNQWVTPPYTLTVPGNLADCDYQNPDAACIPFVGGRLMVSYYGGDHDTYVWQVHLPPEPVVDTTQSCAAFPLTVQQDIRSVTPPGTGANPYPDLAEFTGPPAPPAYEDFVYHHPDVPLEDAQEGDVYLLYEGFGSGNFGWLRWNESLSGNAAILAASMTWPGNSRDYTDAGACGDNCPTPLFPYLVRGYVNPTDNMDISLGIGDWALANTGVTNSNALRDVLDEHAILSRQLRLLVWDVSASPGNNGMYRVARFAVFRLAGYHMQDGAWVLLEFVRWDDSCGQVTQPFDLDVTGPMTGLPQQPYTFTAAVPPTATLPITYTWQASNITETITHTGGVSDTAVFSWDSWGEQVIMVTAVNLQGIPVVTTHTITITPWQLYLPIVRNPD